MIQLFFQKSNNNVEISIYFLHLPVPFQATNFTKKKQEEEYLKF